MKNIFKVLLSLSVSIALLASCNVEHKTAIYSPQNQTEVSFVQNITSNTEIPSAQNTFDIIVARNSANAAIEVPVTSTMPKGVVCPSSISFAAGEFETKLTLDISAIQVAVKYSGTISLSDTLTFNKNIANSEITVTLQKAYTWVSLGMGEWFDQLALMSADSYGIQPVEVLKADGFNRYRIMNPYANTDQLAAAWGASSLGGAKNSYIEFWVLDNGVNVAWDGWWCPGILYDGAGTDIKAYYPSYLTGSTAEDVKSKIFEEKVIGFYPYWYIDGVGGFGTKYPCFLSLPGGPKIETLL